MIAGTGRAARVAVFLASRSLLRGNASVTLMTVLMMAVVFISVVFLPSLINGAVDAIERQVTETATADLTITASDEPSIDRAGDYIDRISQIPGVRAATGTRRIGNQVTFGEQSNAWGVDAIDPTGYGTVFTTPDHLIEGHWLTPGDTRGIVLGVDIAGADRTGERGYSGSLRHVHTGDRVEVSLLGGSTATFTVRGVYDNNFVLSDQGAFVTVAAADALKPATDFATTVNDLFDAVDHLTQALTGAQGGVEHLATTQAATAAASDDVAGAAGRLAAVLRRLDTSATRTAHGSKELATSAGTVAKSTGTLADTVARLSDTVATTVIPAADALATHAATSAQTAAGLAASCPTVVAIPDRCAQESALAASTAQQAQEAASLAARLHATGQALGDIAESTASLARATNRLADAAADLATGSAQLAAGTDTSAKTSQQLAQAAHRVATGADALAGASRDLAASMDSGSPTGADDQQRADLEEAVAGPASFPEADTVSRVFVKTGAGTSAGRLTSEISGLRAGVQFRTAAELAAAIQDQIDTFQLINDIMRVISLLVAAITVFILTYVELTNRRRQIGIERAIGIRGTAIVSSYVLKSMINALIGVAFGLVLYRAALLPFVARHPFHFPNGDVVLVADPATTRFNVALLVVVAVVAAAVPTVNTIRMKILDAIWGR